MPPIKLDPANPVSSFKRLLLELVRGYEFDVEGLYLKSGAVRPLPKEAAVVGKVLEVSIHEYLSRRLLAVSGLKVIPASSDRVYPDLTFDGPLIYPHRFALDVKCARRAGNGVGTTSAITIGTFDAEYFHNPDHKAPNIMMPYSSYTAHLALIALYDYVSATARSIELLVVEKWRVATTKRASGTRCYIAAVKSIEALRQEKGEFLTEEGFNTYWRSQQIGAGKEQKWRGKRSGGLT